MEKKQSNDANTMMSQKLELPDKDLKACQKHASAINYNFSWNK